MNQKHATHPLREIKQADLTRLARAADRLLAGHPNLLEGPLRSARRPGRGMEFFDFQRYQPGGDVRTIDWCASARSRHKLMRRYHQDMSSEWIICLDRSASMRVPDLAKWNLAVQLAAAFLFLLLHRTDRVGLLSFSSDVDVFCPLGRGHAQFKRGVSLLSGVPCQGEGGSSNLLACAKWIGRQRSVFVISDFLAPDAMRPALGSLRRLGGGVHALQVLSAVECAPPPTSDALLRDIESGERLAIGTTPDGHETAADRLNSLRSDLGAHCRRSGIRFSTCTTDQPWRAVVLEHLTRVGGHNA